MKTKTFASGASLHDIACVADERGVLNALELARDVPFDCKRVFYVYGVKEGCVRGEHAHHECQEFLIALRGSVKVSSDDGAHRDEILLDSPSKGLHLPSKCWTEQYDHSPDCILLVLASHPYEGKDYIRSYEDFLSLRRSLKEGGKTHG